MSRTVRYLLVFIIAIAALLFVGKVFAAGTGFITDPLWLTPENPKDGEKATLSAAFRNADKGAITGNVLFYDGDVLLAKKPIDIPAGQIGTVATTFTMSAGDHNFSASLNTLTVMSADGKAEPVIVPDDTAKLPEQFVQKKLPLSAQAAGSAASAGEQTILNQVDKAEKKVLEVIPEPTKKVVANVATRIDDWRAARVTTFTDGQAAAKQTIADQNKTKVQTVNTIAGSKEIEVSDAKGGLLTGPWAYIKLFFFKVFAYLFSTPLLFYFIGALLSYFIIRFIFRKIGKLFKKRHKPVE